MLIKSILMTAALFASLSAPADENVDRKSLLVNLRASAASCSITSSGEATTAFLVGRDNGPKSAKYKAALDTAYRKSQACVDEEKPKIKPMVKSQIEAHPAMRDAMLDAYAKWIGYMDWLSTPHDWGTESTEEAAFEQAANRLQAEMDLQ